VESKAEKYRAKAAESERQAAAAKSFDAKQKFLNLARQWRELAKSVEDESSK